MLIRKNFKIREDQVTFLESCENESAEVRKALDNHIQKKQSIKVGTVSASKPLQKGG